MLLIPAIDLKDGQCVRLKQGDMNQATVFSNSPVEQAQYWVSQGAERLHLVDLNGAFAGNPVNEQVIRDICNTISDIPIQIGGGVRDLATIKRYLDMGVSYVMIGTAAIKNPELVEQACKTFGNCIIVTLDAKDDYIATDGWAVVTEHKVIDTAKRFANKGVAGILYTDISRDGMLTGLNIEKTTQLAQAVHVPVIASGGLHNMMDIEALLAQKQFALQNNMNPIYGAICGRAIYSGDLDFKSAVVLTLEDDATE